MLVIVVGAGGYVVWEYYESHQGVPVEMIGVTSTAWYRVSENTLRPMDPPEGAVPLTEGVHVLGTLSDGSKLAFTSLGLSRVMPDQTVFQLVPTMNTSSTTPLGTATDDLSLIAIENQMTGAVDIYQFDAENIAVTFIGIAKLPTVAPVTEEQFAITAQALELAGLAATSTPGGRVLTSEEAVAFSQALTQLNALPAAVSPAAVAFSGNYLYAQALSGSFYRFECTSDKVGSAEPVTVTSPK